MATTSNTYTGNGSNKLFSITFPYLETTDVDVYLNGTLQTITTQYTFANATTVEFVTAPANGATILLDRSTDDTDLQATFFPGSAIKAADLNLDFDQVLYIAQETANEAATATSTAATATTTANTALSQSSAAVSTANTASSNASAAVSTANTASTNASNAVTTANTASSNASTAVTTANAAVVTANTASSNASAAVSTANTASSNASAAVSTANTASSNATAAVSTANTASTNASNAVTTANNAVTTANNAVTTANSAQTAANNAVVTSNLADTKANQAIAAVAASINYTLVANVAAIPASPANGTYIEVADSTGIQSFTPLVGLPGGFVGDSGLTVRLVYQTSNTSWNWLTYFANNSETRYLKLTGGTLTGALTLSGAPSSGLQATTKTYVDTADATLTTAAAAAQTTANAAVVRAGDTMTGALGVTAGTASAPSLYFTGDTNTGLFSAGADQVAIATGGSGRLFIDASGNVGVGVSPTNASGYSTLDINNATNGGRLRFLVNGTAYGQIYNNAATDFRCGTVANVPFHLISNASIALTVDTSQRVGIGTSAPAEKLHVVTSGGKSAILIGDTAASSYSQVLMYGGSTKYNWSIGAQYNANNALEITPSTATEGTSFTTPVAVFTQTGRVGIGTTSPQGTVHVTGASGTGDIVLQAIAADARLGGIRNNGGALSIGSFGATGVSETKFLRYGEVEAARLDSSGRFLVGTSSARVIEPYGLGADGQTAHTYESVGDASPGPGLALCSNSATARMGPYLYFSRSGAASVGSNTVVVNGDNLGTISFAGADGTDVRTRGAAIYAEVDGTPGANDMPGRLVFATTADGAASPTERFRITSTGAQFSVIPGGSTIYPQFACRAWVNFNGTGTAVGGNPAIRASGNVSSITDNGTGNYTVTFATSMPDANYAIVGTSSTDSAQIGVFTSVAGATDFSKSTSAVTVLTVSTNSSAGRDYNSVNIAIFR